MAKRKSHPQVEFQVTPGTSTGQPRTFRTFAEASEHAISSASAYGKAVNLDVLVWTRGGAKFWMGDWGVEVYDEDPDASVFQRIVIRAEDQGRIA